VALQGGGEEYLLEEPLPFGAKQRRPAVSNADTDPEEPS